MLARIIGTCKICWYKLIWGKRFSITRLFCIEPTARINLKKGILSIGSEFGMKHNSYLAIVNGGNLQIGNRVSINRNSVIVCHDRIFIGDDCAIAPNVAVYDHDHRFGIEGLEIGFSTSPVIIERRCWIGAGTVILRGTHIGEGCVIGAGCVVKGEIPAHSLVTANRELSISPITERRRSIHS